MTPILYPSALWIISFITVIHSFIHVVDIQHNLHSYPMIGLRLQASSYNIYSRRQHFSNLKAIHVTSLHAFQRGSTTENNAEKKKGKSGSKERGGVVLSSGTRLNKCISSLSRRAADDAITEGRVTINERVATIGDRAEFGDKIRLDGKLQHWEENAIAKKVKPAKIVEERDFMYIKYWKPRGVTCTSDAKDKSNIISAGRFDLFPQRLFSVGRLDKDSTGLILLTSDGRVNNAILSPTMKKEKIYDVELDHAPTDEQIQRLRDGVVISTSVQRDNSNKIVTARTLPCKINRIGGINSSVLNNHYKLYRHRSFRRIEFTLTEGRNRQIRRMVEAIGMTVVNLHRTSFAGISLKGVKEGDWMELTEKEMALVTQAIGISEKNGSGSSNQGTKYFEELSE